jgi:hypothetical protein
MNIGELFVNLGVKGGGETQKTLKGVKGGMKDVKSMSLEAKAAIIATVYGLKQLMSQSMQQGTALTQFTNLTGQSIKKLQQWQYVNKLAGGTAEEVTGVVTGMQQAFAQLELGEGPAKYLGLFAEGLAEVQESFDTTKMNDVFYILEKARAFINSPSAKANIGVANEALSSMGISPSMIAGLRGGAFSDRALNAAPTYSEGEANALKNANSQWLQLSETIQKTIGRLNVKFGGQLVKDLKEIVTQMALMAEAAVNLANDLKILAVISESLKGWAMLFKEIREYTSEKDPETASMENAFNKTVANKDGNWGSKTGASFGEAMGDFFRMIIPKDSNSGINMGYMNALKPDVNDVRSGGSNTTINQVLNIGQGANIADVKDGARKGANQGVQSAYRQLSAQGL